jgi:DNA-binding LytR/AlgR family response regulator
MLKRSLVELERTANLSLVMPTQLKKYSFQRNENYVLFLELVYSKSGVDGFHLAETLRKQNMGLSLVFVSNHVECMPYILRGNIVPSGFLKKPPQQSETSEVFRNILSLKDNFNEENCFTLNLPGETVRVPCQQILYFESLQKKINIHTLSRRYSIYSSLAAIESEVGGGFVRCHNSFVINRGAVKAVSFSDMLVTMENGAVLPISRTFRQNMKDAFPDI